MQIAKQTNPRSIYSRDAGLLLRELGAVGVQRLGSPKGQAVTGEVSTLPLEDGQAFAFHFQSAVFIEQQAPGLATFLSAKEGLAVELSEPSRTFAVEGTGLLYMGGAPTKISVRADTPVQGFCFPAHDLIQHLSAWHPERDEELFGRGVLRFDRTQVGPINRFLEFLLREASVSQSSGGSVSRRRSTAVLMDLLIEQFEDEAERSSWSISPGHLKRAESFVLANLASDLTAAEVALAVGVSPRSLYRAFQDFRGLSFSQFVRGIRMDAARAMLRDEPDLSLKAVAQRVGYGDYTSFWRHFRARFGVSPSEGEGRLAA